jgi:hypothetical protein
MSPPYTVILVYATSHAIHLEKRLAGADIPCKMIPTPRHLSSDCGVCLRIERAQNQAAQRVIAASGLETAGFFDI